MDNTTEYIVFLDTNYFDFECNLYSASLNLVTIILNFQIVNIKNSKEFKIIYNFQMKKNIKF